MRRYTDLVRCVGLVALLFLPVRAAIAHAVLMASTPESGATVPSGHLGITLRYNSRIDHARSRVSLGRPDRSESVLPIAGSSPPDALDTVTDLGAGAYVLHWQVLAIDGHITRGDVPFMVRDQGH